MTKLPPSDARSLLLTVGEVFRPSAPIDEEGLFAGRNHELFSVVEAIQSAGQHAVIYGERGVGKTSLARVAMKTIEPLGYLAVRVNCDASDDFASIWRKVIDELFLVAGEVVDPKERESLNVLVSDAANVLSSNSVNPGTLRIALRRISTTRPLVIFLDEFNEVQDSESIVLLSSALKTLSDYTERVTICPIAVAESLDLILEGHLSAIRAVVQVRMPRMRREELVQILEKGLERLSMSASSDAKNLVRVIPRGLPQYAHLLAQEGARQALMEEQNFITGDHVMAGLKIGLSKLDHSLNSAYEKATYSPRATRLKEVLLACAIARLGDMGTFSPTDIKASYSRIIGEDVGVDRFNPQLTTLATIRGILTREGEERRWRYRFTDPLMEPYVLLEGLRSGVIVPADFPYDSGALGDSEAIID